MPTPGLIAQAMDVTYIVNRRGVHLVVKRASIGIKIRVNQLHTFILTKM